ncbi:MAG: FixH family protein [Bacteroidota bacterium]
MKKFNWGTGITIVIILFLIISIGQVLVIHYLVDYDLVVEEYYEEEIKYQDQIDKLERTKNLPEQLQIKLVNKVIEFTFPSIFESESITGAINFYKPSDDLLDKVQTIKLNKENKTFTDTKQLTTGLWRVKVEWNVDTIKYYNEESFMVP